jgi:dipeptidyl aminopeptidase/acylaminoacyl peptidase
VDDLIRHLAACGFASRAVQIREAASGESVRQSSRKNQMTKMPILKCVTFLLMLCFALRAAVAQGTRADYDRADHYDRLVRNKTFRMSVNPHWTADGNAFWYRNEDRDGLHDFVWVDAVAGTRLPAFDEGKLAAPLSKATGRSCEVGKMPIDAIEPGDKPNLRVVHVAGKRWQVDLDTYAVTPLPGRGPAEESLPALTEIHPSRPGGAESSITFENKTRGPISLFWSSTNGDLVAYGQIAAGESFEQNTFVGHVWVVKNQRGRTLGVYEATDGGGDVVIQPRGNTAQSPEAGADDNSDAEAGDADGNSVRSPDGKWTAFLRKYNVFVHEQASGKDFQLSTDGVPADSYETDFKWSPDSKKLVALKTLDGEHHTVYEVQSSPPDQLQPKLLSFEYLKPGDRIPLTRPHLFDIESKKEISISDRLFPNPWALEDVRWDRDSQRFTFFYNQRGHQVLRIIAVDAASGKAMPIVDEQSKTFIYYNPADDGGKMFRYYLPETREIIWMSERDGWNHLYLYDSSTGQVKNQITKGQWVVRKVDRVDAAKRQIWFEAGGIHPDHDPYYIDYCRVNFDGSDLTVLTQGDGTHKIAYSPDGRFFIDTYSRMDDPPTNELRRSSDGKMICPLEKGDIHDLFSGGWKLPERFVAKGRDGVTDIYGVIYRPSNFDPAKKYPILEDIYAGPQNSFVPKSFQRSTNGMQMAELGFIVVQIDGMGTSNRSKAFHDVCWRNLGDAGFPDRILWMKAAAAKYPYMDISRVGVYGTSAGGQDALRAVEAFGDFYKAAVADCGCHDNRMDKIWWNEQWMGWPIGPWYDQQSNVTNAKDLHGALLLIVGETDHNVDPASTMQVVNALIKADKDFDLLVIPNADHGEDGAYGNRRRKDFFVRHLLGVEPRAS